METHRNQNQIRENRGSEGRIIDLHMHSRYSNDGEFSPRELVEKCAAQGIGIMSVADHNCAKANREALSAAEELGMRYIPGIEIDCTYEGTDFHVLGYGIDFESQDFEQIEKNVASQSARASREMLAATRALGFEITETELESVSENGYWKNTWTGEMFAEVLLAKPEYLDHPILRPYRPGGDRSDNPFVNFYWDYYSQGKPCFSSIQYPSMEEIIRLIHHNHGAAVLAHPGVNLKGREALLEGILSLGIDGLEAYSSYHTPEQAAYFAKRARERGLALTCGSDYHGKTKPSISLGQHGCPLSYGELEEQLLALFRLSSL